LNNATPQYVSNFNRKIQLCAFKHILKWNSDQFRDFVSQMPSLGDKLINEIIFGEIDKKYFLRPHNIINLAKSKNYFILSQAAKSFLAK
jgi:hypothetical protein